MDSVGLDFLIYGLGSKGAGVADNPTCYDLDNRSNIERAIPDNAVTAPQPRRKRTKNCGQYGLAPEPAELHSLAKRRSY